MRALRSPPGHGVEGGLGQEQRTRPRAGRDVELGRRDDRDLLQVAEALDETELVLGRDEHDRSLEAGALEERARRLRRRLVEGVRGENGQRPIAGVAPEGRTQNGFRGLAVDLLDERARHLREGVTAALELRRADRTLACAAGALLAPRLRAAAGDEATALRRGSACALRVQLRADGLVHEVRLDLHRVDALVERDVL